MDGRSRARACYRRHDDRRSARSDRGRYGPERPCRSTASWTGGPISWCWRRCSRRTGSAGPPWALRSMSASPRTCRVCWASMCRSWRAEDTSTWLRRWMRSNIVRASTCPAPEAVPFVVAGESDKFLTWANPIRSPNGPLTLVLQRSLASALRPYDDIRNSMLAIGAVLLAIASVLSVLLARSATRPVEELTKAVERLEAGDYAVEVPPASTTELKGLASAFNAMRSAVADREATIRHQANHNALTGLPTRARISAMLDDMLIRRARSRPPGDRVPDRDPSVPEHHRLVRSRRGRRSAVGGGAAAHGVRARRRGRRAYRHRPIPGRSPTTSTARPRPGRRRRSSIACAAPSTTRRSRSSSRCASAPPAFHPTATMPPSSCSAPISRCFAPRRRAPRSASTSRATTTSQRDRLSILGELRRAIASNELELHYQPKVHGQDRADRRLRGAGPLAASATRVHSAERVHPACRARGRDPLSDQLGGRDRAAGSSPLGAAGMKLDVSINVSPVDFVDPGFADKVGDAPGADRCGRLAGSCSR